MNTWTYHSHLILMILTKDGFHFSAGNTLNPPPYLFSQKIALIFSRKIALSFLEKKSSPPNFLPNVRWVCSMNAFDKLNDLTCSDNFLSKHSYGILLDRHLSRKITRMIFFICIVFLAVNLAINGMAYSGVFASWYKSIGRTSSVRGHGHPLNNCNSYTICSLHDHILPYINHPVYIISRDIGQCGIF